MTAKEYLGQLRTINIRIASISEQLKNLRSAAEHCSPNYSVPYVPSERNIHAAEDAIIRLIDWEERLAAEFIKLDEINNTIAKLKDPIQHTVIVKHYISGKTWRQIAAELNYSERAVRYIHSAALEELQKNIAVNCRSFHLLNKTGCVILILTELYIEGVPKGASFLYPPKDGDDMPHKPKKPCAYPGCPNLTDGYYCDDHKSKGNFEYNHYRRNPNTNKRYGNEWRKIRARYVKAHPLCEECLRNVRYTPVQEVHHIKPLAEGGTYNETNLMSLCKSCHSAITITETNRKSHVRT